MGAMAELAKKTLNPMFYQKILYKLADKYKR